VCVLPAFWQSTNGNTQYPIPNTNTQAKCNSKSMLLVAASSQKGFVVGGDRAKNGFATGIRF